jgi:dipeptidyl aminopeptidase/acylaminoacyl peptidase
VSEPYGSWPSPISAAMVAGDTVGLSAPRLEQGVAYWHESRPNEGGRIVVVRAAPFAEPEDVTPAGFNVRTRVHEYGGGASWLRGDTVFFTNFSDQRLYRQDGVGQAPVPITPDTDARHRYADGRAIPGTDLLVCVRERHEPDGEVVNELVVLPDDGSADPSILAAGHDFFCAPRPSPDGRWLAYVCWDHPNMPWDGTELVVAELAERALNAPFVVAGGARESAQQPVWETTGALHLVSDRTGWWNLYRADPDGPGGAPRTVTALHPMDADFGFPQWVFGLATYGFLDDGRIACGYVREGWLHHGVLDADSGELLDLDLALVGAPHGVPTIAVEGTRILTDAGGSDTPQTITSLDFGARSVDVLRSSAELAFDASYVSTPEHVSIPTSDGSTAYAFVYPPTNPDVSPPEDELPPLLVQVHGGPTGAASPMLDLSVQYFTSRGFAVADVDYRGSTGYGREYRDALLGAWGIVDVADCVDVARVLADRGEVDGDRLTISGGSAGGYVALCALTFHAGVFAAGASYFGIADLEALAQDTHKFESRYTDRLVAPYPEQRDVYRARSPIHFTDRLSSPLLILQGLEDEVVPPSQAEMMAAALREKGLAYAYLAFEGEQHGFRKTDSLVRSLEAELSFYGQVLGFEPAGGLPRLEVENL